MRHIIIYAMGKVFEKYCFKINWKEIVAVADKKDGISSDGCDVPVIKPEQIMDFSFDYIAVFSNNLFEEIKTELIGYYFVPENKIIPWKALFPADENMDDRIIEQYKKIIREFRFRSVLDIGMPYFPKYFFCKENILSGFGFQMDGIGNCKYLMGHNLYENIYEDVKECSNEYQAALLWGDFDDLNKTADRLKNKVRYILLHVLYSSETQKKIEYLDEYLKKTFVYKRFSMNNMILWLIDLKPKETIDDIGIYVVTHKSYNLRCDELYHPLCVGNFYMNERYLTEKKGDNISYLNEKINECTALYWIWKNTNSKYVGLNHYRRFFYNNNIRSNGNYLDKETACELLEEYDIILAESVMDYRRNMLDVILDSMDRGLCIKALEILIDVMKKYQPDYVELFEHIINGHSFHPCNMFVTHRRIFNAYCNWMFSFLIEAAEKIDVKEYGEYDKRVMGFMAERLLTTWILKQDFKIKELPCVVVSK